MAPPFIKRYLLALDRHKWAGLTGFLVVTGLSGVAAVLQPPPAPVYVARSILTYSAPPDTFSQTGTALKQQGEGMTKDMLLSSYVIGRAIEQLKAENIELASDEILAQVSVKTNNDAAAGDAKDDKGGSKKDSASGSSLRAVVIYQDANKDQAETVLAALLAAMVEQSRQFNTQQLNSIIDNLQQLSPKVMQEVRQAEQNLEAFVRKEGTAIQAAESGALVGAITGSQQQQREIRLNLAGIDAQLRSLQNRLGMTPDQAYASSALSADPIISNLRNNIYQAESKIDVLSKTLRPEHPSVVEITNQLAVFNQLLEQRVAEVMGGSGQAAPLPGQIRQASSLDPARQQLASTLVNLQTQRDTLIQQLSNLSRSEQQLRGDYSTIPNKQLEQQRLEQQVTLKRAFYDQIQARLADATLAKQETVGNLVVAQEPKTEATIKPGASGIVILLVGGVIGLVVGGGLILLLDSIDPKFYTLEDLQGALRQEDVPVLGILPTLPDNPDHELSVIATANSGYVEVYERLRGNLRRATGGKALKMLLLTSTVSQEGKSLSAYNLAIASARAGRRTLLIEADLRSPSHSPAVRLTPDPDSLAEPLRYYGNLSECIRLVPDVENLYLVPSVGPQRQAAAVLESSEMRRLLEDSRGRFDLVVLDTPPLSRYNDALLLEPYTDGIVLVTRPGYTEEGLLVEVAQQFMESETIQFLGAIINDTDIPVQLRAVIQDDDPLELYDFDHELSVDEVGVR